MLQAWPFRGFVWLSPFQYHLHTKARTTDASLGLAAGPRRSPPMMLRGNLKQVRIEKNPARLRALESAAGESEPTAAMALVLAG